MPKRTIVDVHKLRLKTSRTNYWRHVSTHNKMNEEGEYLENVEANPDMLLEEDAVFKQRGPRELRAMQLLEEAVGKLTAKQREVYVAYYRDGKSETEIGAKLNIDQRTVSDRLTRALAYVTEYCRMRADELDEAYDGQD